MIISLDSAARSEVAVLGGGCFWCLEAVFDDIDGVLAVESGYSGGHVEHPGYAQVCEGDTGHAEVVRIEFDPSRIAYRDLLEVFFAIHDPTTLNRQGNDVGTQYRSAIFFQDDVQRDAAQAYMREVAPEFRAPLVTQLLPAAPFYRAEDYHQEYFRLHGEQPYCRLVVAPKLAKFREKFAHRRRAQAR